MAADRGNRAPHYHIYILTAWRDSSAISAAAGSPWRYSLENPRTGERLGFKDVAELHEFLGRLDEEGAEDRF